MILSRKLIGLDRFTTVYISLLMVLSVLLICVNLLLKNRTSQTLMGLFVICMFPKFWTRNKLANIQFCNKIRTCVTMLIQKKWKQEHRIFIYNYSFWIVKWNIAWSFWLTYGMASFMSKYIRIASMQLFYRAKNSIHEQIIYARRMIVVYDNGLKRLNSTVK